MDSFPALLSWYLAIQVMGAAVFPALRLFFRHSRDRGYFFSKIVGVGSVGLLLWLGTAYGLLRNEAGGVWLALAAVAILSWVWGSGLGPTLTWIRSNSRLVWVAELLFLGAFAAWAWVRAHDPSVSHTEQPMDLMFLSAVSVSPTFPPLDPWLSGWAISYYYFGYWLLNTPALMTGLPAELAYNLGQAGWFGFLLMGSFGLAFNLASRQPKGAASPFWCGALGAVMVGLMGNLQVVMEVVQSRWGRLEALAAWFDVHGFPTSGDPLAGNWWWWRSSRVVQDYDHAGGHIEVISEFPIFSYVLGDNHPHLLAMPFLLLAGALAFELVLSVRAGAEKKERPWQSSRAVVATAAATGALLFLNPWDYPGVWTVTLAALLTARLGMLQERPRSSMLSTAAWGMQVTGLGILIYLPFFLTAESQVEGIAPNWHHPTRTPQFLLMFGAFLPAVALLIGLGNRRYRTSLSHKAKWMALTLGAPILFLGLSYLLIRFGPGVPFLSAPGPVEAGSDLALGRTTLLLVGILLALTLAAVSGSCRKRDRESPGGESLPFVLILGAVGLFLVLVPEFAFIRDTFGTRMNTVFKFYYQAWLWLSIGAAFAIWMGMRRPGVARWLAVLSLGLVTLGCLYPVLAIPSKTQNFQRAAPTLDASADLKSFSPNEWKALEWVRSNVPPGRVVLQTWGDSYRSDHNRISVYSARPTLLGWQGHELQWRGRRYGELVDGRREAVDTVYSRGAPAAIREALRRWEIDYVFLGPVERDRHQVTPDREKVLEQVLEVVFESGGVRVYRRRPDGF